MKTGKVASPYGNNILKKIGRFGVNLGTTILQPLAPIKSTQIRSAYGLSSHTINSLQEIIQQSDDKTKGLATMALGKAFFYKGIKDDDKKLIAQASKNFYQVYQYEDLGINIKMEARFNDAICSYRLNDLEGTKNDLQKIIDLINSCNEEELNFKSIETKEVSLLYLNKIAYDKKEIIKDKLDLPAKKTFGKIKNFYLYRIARKQFYQYLNRFVELDIKKSLAEGKVWFGLPEEMQGKAEKCGYKKNQQFNTKELGKTELYGILAAKYISELGDPFLALTAAQHVSNKSANIPSITSLIYSKLRLDKKLINLLQNIAKKKPDAEILIELAMAYRKIGKNIKAWKYFEKVRNFKKADKFYQQHAEFCSIGIAIDLALEGKEVIPKETIKKRAEKFLKSYLLQALKEDGKKNDLYRNKSAIQIYEILKKENKMPETIALEGFSLESIYTFLKDVEELQSGKA